jgi:hypothetical protein
MQRFDVIQITSLTIIAILELLQIFGRSSEFTSVTNTILLMFLWYVPIATPLSDYFRNIFYYVLWLCACVCYLFIHADLVTSILPLFIAIYAQLARIVFVKIYDYEPIALFSYQSPIERKSSINNRSSNQKDFRYSLIRFFIGVILSILIGIKYR